MSIRLKDTIYNKSKDTETLEGYSRSNLFKSIPDWISASNLVEDITVTGSSANFYPVVITVSTSKAFPTYITIVKNLGTTTPSISGNHESGTSSLWLRYEMRNTSWDGNGGYIKTWYKSQSYGTLVSHVETDTKGHGGLIVWLRGGTCSYSIACTNTFSVNVYYSTTNIGSTTYPNEVSPRTDVGNAGILSSVVLGYGNLSGNASTASKLANARTISLTGAVTGSVSFDGSQNVILDTTKNHTHNYTSTIKIGTSTTEYKCTDNTIILPAYPTLSSLGASPEHTHPYLLLSGGTLTGDFAANSETKTPYSLTTKLNHVRKNLNWSNDIENSYIEHVIPLIPVPTTKNWIGINYIDGKFLMWKKGGNVYDVVEVSLNCVYNTLYYTFTCSGNYSSSYGLCIIKYNGVNYYAIDCPYHANPYTDVEFYGSIKSTLPGGTSSVALPLDIEYYNANTKTVLNSEVYNSKTTTLTTSVITTATVYSLRSIGGFSGKLIGNADSASKLANARTVSLTGAITGSGTFDGTDNLSITTSVNHTHNYVSSIKIGTSTTEYKCTNNTITLPAYPTIPTIPTSLKNPYSLTIKGNGTELGKYDGSTAKTINITYSDVGAAPAAHTHDKVKTVTPSGSASGWYRVGMISTSNAGYSQNVIISLQRSYTSPENEHYIFSISIGYNGYISITQLSGLGAYISKNGRLIEKVRIVWNNSGNCYFDYYMKSGNYSNGYKVTVLAGDFTALQDIVLVTSAGGSVTEFTTTNGCKSNYGFTGDLIGNATTATTASKLAVPRTISLTGAITGSGTFDGSDNLSIATSVNHTHSYAGSSSAGGAATIANKLNANAGGTTTPVYFTGGVPTACSVASGDATASTIAVRNSSGDIYARLIRQTYEDQDTISGGIVYRVNNSTDNYLRVCKSTSAIREYLGVPSSSDLSSYLPRQRMTNPDPGHASVGTIPLILALKSAGTPVYTDPEFKNGVNSCYVYNNSGNSSVTVSHITDNQNSGNSSGKILQISTTTGTASPGRGGFYQTMTSRAGAVFCQIFRAKIPTGFTLSNNENSMGSGYKTYWMTNKAGTGKWEWYCRITICGTSGTFGGGGHVSLNSDAGGNVAVTWYISYCNLIDLTRGHHDGLRTIYSDSSLCADKLGTFSLSKGTVTGTSAGTGTNPVYFLGGVPTACTYSLNKTVPSDAKFTDTTYSSGSGISINGTTINNSGVRSISTGTTNGTLSVNTGGASANVSVKGLAAAAYCSTTTSVTSGSAALITSGAVYTALQNKSNSHSHPYAGSSSQGGAANSANKLNTDAGSKSNPVYFLGGIPVECDPIVSKRYYSINATSLSTSNFYPVTFDNSDLETDCEIHSPGNSASAAYNQNSIHFYYLYRGWNDTPSSFRILHYGCYDFNEITIGAIGCGTQGGMQCVWVRGGMIYRFYSNKVPTLRTSTYSNGNEKFTVGTNYYGGTNSNVNIVWRAKETTYRFSVEGHTHNYAGSSSAGGAANNSLKWGGYSISVGSSSGSDSNTIYFVV